MQAIIRNLLVIFVFSSVLEGVSAKEETTQNILNNSYQEIRRDENQNREKVLSENPNISDDKLEDLVIEKRFYLDWDSCDFDCKTAMSSGHVMSNFYRFGIATRDVCKENGVDINHYLNKYYDLNKDYIEVSRIIFEKAGLKEQTYFDSMREEAYENIINSDLQGVMNSINSDSIWDACITLSVYADGYLEEMSKHVTRKVVKEHLKSTKYWKQYQLSASRTQ